MLEDFRNFQSGLLKAGVASNPRIYQGSQIPLTLFLSVLSSCPCHTQGMVWLCMAQYPSRTEGCPMDPPWTMPKASLHSSLQSNARLVGAGATSTVGPQTAPNTWKVQTCSDQIYTYLDHTWNACLNMFVFFKCSRRIQL